MKTNYLSIVILAISIYIGGFSSAYGQERESNEFMLEEVTVTAEKRETQIQETPMSITAISGDTLKQEGKSSLLEILQGIPGVSIRPDSHGAKFFIRGVTENLTWQAEQPTATYTDGVYVANPGEARGAYYDMSRLEVAKGPQGTLYGFNALGGAVNIISNDPVDIFEGSSSLEAGNFSLLKTESVLNMPLGESFAARAAIFSENRDGYLSNGAEDSVMTSGRIKLLWRPEYFGGRFQILLTTEKTEVKGLGIGSAGPYDPETQPAIEDLKDPWYCDKPASENDWHQTITRSYGKLDWDFGYGTLKYQYSHSVYDADDHFWGSTMFFKSVSTRTTDSHELQLTSPESSAITWTAGANHLKKQKPAIVGNDIRPKDNTITTGIYGQITYPVIDWLRVTGGLRYSRDKGELAIYVLNVPDSYSEGEDTWNATTWKLGVEADVGQDSLLYASASTGYRTGGFVGMSTMFKAFEPAEMIAYDVGFKSKLLNDRLQLNADLYLYQYDNYQLSYQVPDPITGEANIAIVNSKDADFYGAEVESIYLLTQRDRISGSISYSQSDLGEIPTGGGLEQYSHNPSDHSPEWTLSLSYEHLWDFENGGDLNFKISTFCETKYWTSFKQEVGTEQPAYHVSNASLLYSFPNGKWSVQGYVRNIEDYPVLYEFGGFTVKTYRLGPPRTFGVNVSVKF